MKVAENKLVFILFSVILLPGCVANKFSSKQPKAFAKGADIRWLLQMEATGYKFYNGQGIEQDCFQILKDHGINTIRLRTWVNPSNDKARGNCQAAKASV